MKPFVLMTVFCMNPTACHFDTDPSVTEFDTASDCIQGLSRWTANIAQYFLRQQHTDNINATVADTGAHPGMVMGLYFVGRAAGACFDSDLTEEGKKALQSTPRGGTAY